MRKLTILLFTLAMSTTLGVAQTNCPAVKDVDGNTYKAVQIGRQCWLAENMRATHDRNGHEILLGRDKSSSTPFRYNPNGKSRNVEVYGYLYNWEAAKVVCPNGWHLPSDAEWTQLSNYVSSQNQYCCGNNADNNVKALATTSGWKKCSKPCTVGYHQNENNTTGFSALPAGGFYNGGYDYFGHGTFFWSATEMDAERAYKRYIDYDAVSIVRYNYYKFGAGAVRCVRNEN